MQGWDGGVTMWLAARVVSSHGSVSWLLEVFLGPDMEDPGCQNLPSLPAASGCLLAEMAPDPEAFVLPVGGILESPP